MGFSRRKNCTGKGQRPKCKGCGKLIGYEEECLRNKWKKLGNTWPTTDQFHLVARCVGKMQATHLGGLLAKQWKDPKVEQVVEEIKVASTLGRVKHSLKGPGK